MKKILIIALLFIACSSTIPQPKNGESYYAESVKDGMQVLEVFKYKLNRIDTIRIKGSRDIYLFHYKN
jgi:hypothetical protein